MSSVSAYIRAKSLGLEDHNPEAARQAAEHYLREVAAKDDRRILWLVEGAANALADEMEAEEVKITRHTTFKRESEAAKCQERLDRLTEDFRFLWALITLCREQHFQRSAMEFGEWIKRQRKPRRPG
jgi:hypothetical protein